MNESVVVECSQCGKKSKLKSALLGKTVRCPGCKEKFEAVATTNKPSSAKKSVTKKKDSSGGDKTVPLVIGGGIVGLIAVAGIAFLAAGMLPKKGDAAKSKVAAVEKFAHYNAQDAAFQCDHPDGWEIKSGGAKNSAWAQFGTSTTYIKVAEKIVGSLLGDIGGNRTEDDGELSTVASVHAEKKRFYEEEEFKNYVEEPAEPVKCTFGWARRSVFTASGSWGKKLKGYRVTVMGAVRQIDIICLCPEADFDTLKPAFIKSMESLALGTKI